MYKLFCDVCGKENDLIYKMNQFPNKEETYPSVRVSNSLLLMNHICSECLSLFIAWRKERKGTK